MCEVISQNDVLELAFSSAKSYQDPFNEIQLKAIFIEPDGKEKVVSAFWSGDQVWKIRYSSAQRGQHPFRTVCSDINNEDLHGQEGRIEVSRYEGSNRLLEHGGLQSSANKSFLEHVDGTPFFWLADTWWMCLTKRLVWPDDFKLLTKDRVDKGFTVIQLVAGLFPDMDPLDDRGANEAGLVWNDDFSCINPAYFDKVDEKIIWLVQSGLVPCIVGCWGYYLEHAGEEVIRKHWDYLLARYGAYPVIWCMAGEALMPFYKSEAFSDPEKKQEYINQMRGQWTKLTRHVKQSDAFRRPITIHPTDFGHDMLDDSTLLDLDMLQTGHSSYLSLEQTVKMIEQSVVREPRTPVINSEACYEGLGGTSYQDIQRFLFWSCILSGACGHTYGANGIWQVNSKEQPYGKSPTGVAWGNTSWEEAYQFPGSAQIGLGKRLLERYRWWEFSAHPEWIDQHFAERSYLRPFVAGIPDHVRVIFSPFPAAWGGILVKGIEENVNYRAYYYDPLNGDEYNLGKVIPNKAGNWRSGTATIVQDWVLVLEREK
ncbi:MAG TPA: DUF4038 domain-containing protein [Bacilli bacterium]